MYFSIKITWQQFSTHYKFNAVSVALRDSENYYSSLQSILTVAFMNLYFIMNWKVWYSITFSNLQPDSVWHFGNCHSIVKYGIIFWCDSSNSKVKLISQERIVRSMTDAKPRNSCRNLCKRSETLPLLHEYILLLMNFNVRNQEHCQKNSAVLTQDIRTILIHQVPSFHVFK